MQQTLKINPLGDRVIVKADKAKDKTDGGIYITESEKEKPQTGIVMAKGPGITAPIQLSVGDTVYFSKYGGTEITIDEEAYLTLREGDIIGVKIN